MPGNVKAKTREALQHYRLSSQSVSILAYEAEMYLEQTDIFKKVRYQKTGDPVCAVIINCALNDPTISPNKVATPLEHIWLDAPFGNGGGDDEAYDVIISDDAVQFQFVTITTYGVVITGRIEVADFAASPASH